MVAGCLSARKRRISPVSQAEEAPPPVSIGSSSASPTPQQLNGGPPSSLELPLPLGDELEEAVRRDDAAAVSRSLTGEPAAGLLHAAAEAGSAEVIAVLLDAGASCCAVDEDMQTPLHCAVANGHVAAVERLTALQPCAEMHITDKYKMLPLHLACEGGDPDMIALLLSRGARIADSPGGPASTSRANGGQSAAEGAPAPAAGAPAPASSSDELNGSWSSPSPGSSGRSPVPKRKQLLAMQKSEIGGSAIFIARQHEHHEAVALLERAASGEQIDLPESVANSLREASERSAASLGESADAEKS